MSKPLSSKYRKVDQERRIVPKNYLLLATVFFFQFSHMKLTLFDEIDPFFELCFIGRSGNRYLNIRF